MIRFARLVLVPVLTAAAVAVLVVFLAGGLVGLYRIVQAVVYAVAGAAP